MGSKRSWTDGQLKIAVKHSSTYSDVVRYLGLSPRSAGNWSTVKKYIQKNNLDTSHFTSGKGGDTRAARSKNTLPDSVVFCSDSSVARSVVRRRIVKERGPTCEGCSLSVWLGQSIPLELEHVNGIPNDNRKENLLLLCPNCHALTPTWRGRNNKKEPQVSYCSCGGPKWKYSERCSSCRRAVGQPTKIEWPDTHDLVALVSEVGYSAAGRALGVSDNAIRKRLSRHTKI